MEHQASGLGRRENNHLEEDLVMVWMRWTLAGFADRELRSRRREER